MSPETKTVREMIAYRLYDAGAYCGECDYEGWGECSKCMRDALVFADVIERFLVEDRRMIIAAYCAERNGWMERAHKAEAELAAVIHPFRPRWVDPQRLAEDEVERWKRIARAQFDRAERLAHESQKGKS